MKAYFLICWMIYNSKRGQLNLTKEIADEINFV